MELGSASARYCLDKTPPYLDWENASKISVWNLRTSTYKKLAYKHVDSDRNRKHRGMSRLLWRAYPLPVCVAEHLAVGAENDSEDSPQRILSQPLSNDELMSLLSDTERRKLMIKLSEANQQNRFLKRQLYVTEDALANFKGISLTAQSGIPEGSRKINGKFIQSHLLYRLEALSDKLKEQIKDVVAAQSKEVPLSWSGMAQSVQVMGSFDGWSQGKHLSAECNGSYTKFSTTLMLRPGRYEIKFLIDGEWHLSPEFPTVGEGLTKNNLLIME